MSLELAAYAGIGMFGGFFAGLLGIGGGVLLTPLLVMVYASLGFAPQILVQMAIATAMAIIFLSAIGGAFTHARARSVDWRLSALLVPAVMAGSYAGALSAPHIPGKALIALLLVVLSRQAWRLLRNRGGAQASGAPADAGQASGMKIVPLGLGIGGISSVVGIGGGVILVPVLANMGVPVKRAIGTSSFNTLWIALAATSGYLFPLQDISGHVPDGAFGLVYLPALLVAGAAALPSAVVGAKSAHALPADTLRKVLGVLLTLVALRLLWFLLNG